PRATRVPPPPLRTHFPYTTLFRSRMRIAPDIDQPTDGAGPEVEPEESQPPQALLDVVAEHPEKDHVAEKMHEVGVQKLIAEQRQDRKSTRLNSSHDQISYAVFCLK